MFGLTKREQRWAAEQKAAETIVPLLTAAIEARTAMDTNDRIAALERDLTQAVQMYTDAAGERDKALADLAAAQAERDGLLRIKEAADVLYSEAEEYDLPDGLGMGASQQYWDDLANALFPDDSGEVIRADLEKAQAAIDGAWEAFNEELNKPEFLPCGHHHSMMLKSAETGEPLYCELCDCISRRNDAERDLAAAQAERDALFRSKSTLNTRVLAAEAEVQALRVAHEAALAEAVAKEREACAAIADQGMRAGPTTKVKEYAALIAKAIRARGAA